MADGSVGSPVLFDIQTPDVNGLVEANVASALARRLPEADISRRRLQIVANGPSAVGFNFDAAANWHHHGEAALTDTWAINGALKLFTDRQTAPTGWVACDPQDLVVGFLTDVPLETTYFVASKCAPAVFDRLANRDVRVWHVSDTDVAGRRAVPCAVSVTLCALMLAHRLGYRQIDVYGWDCCFAEDGSHHAATGDLSLTPQIIEMELQTTPPTYFMSNPTWACEVNDAKGILPVLRWCGTEVTIYGRSMVSAILREYAAEVADEVA